MTCFRCLHPLWNETLETDRGLRGKVVRVRDVAKALGIRSGENPSR
jgi:hypothetical protein